jgi:C-terminal processing protease CtpA/Prc
MKYASFLAAIFAAISFGCSTTQHSRPQQVETNTLANTIQTINLASNKGIANVSCERFNADPSGKRAFLGIELSSYEPKVIGFFYCNSISPAERDGVKIGDKIKKIRGCSISTSSEVRSIIQDTPPKSIVFIDVLRENSTKTISIKTISHTPIYPNFPSRYFTAKTCNSN